MATDRPRPPSTISTAPWPRSSPELRVLQFDPGDMRTAMHQAAFPGEDISDRPGPESAVPALRALLASDAPSGRYRAGEWGGRP